MSVSAVNGITKKQLLLVTAGAIGMQLKNPLMMPPVPKHILAAVVEQAKAFQFPN